MLIGIVTALFKRLGASKMLALPDVASQPPWHHLTQHYHDTGRG